MTNCSKDTISWKMRTRTSSSRCTTLSRWFRKLELTSRQINRSFRVKRRKSIMSGLIRIISMMRKIIRIPQISIILLCNRPNRVRRALWRNISLRWWGRIRRMGVFWIFPIVFSIILHCILGVRIDSWINWKVLWRHWRWTRRRKKKRRFRFEISTVWLIKLKIGIEVNKAALVPLTSIGLNRK